MEARTSIRVAEAALVSERARSTTYKKTQVEWKIVINSSGRTDSEHKLLEKLIRFVFTFSYVPDCIENVMNGVFR